jgi:hypothetical protein
VRGSGGGALRKLAKCRRRRRIWPSLRDSFDVGELGLALEQVGDVLCGNERVISSAERADMLAIAEHLNMGERVSRALQLRPGQV